MKQGEAVGPQSHGWHVGVMGARLEVHCQQDQVLSLKKLFTIENSAVVLLRTVTASKLNCPGAWHPEQPHLLSILLSRH